MSTLRQDYLPEHLMLSFQRNGIDGCVAIQVDQSELETHFLIELAKTHSIIKGAVGWIDLRNENIEDRLHYFSPYSIIKGWRHIVQSEADDFLLNENFLRGIKALQPYGYTYDLLVYHYQLKQAVGFVSKFPDQKFIIDHCAKPDIKNKRIDPDPDSYRDYREWKTLMKEMAKHPHVYCKLSGLFTEAAWKEWSAADFYPYLDVVFEAFGTNRLLFGSDWPVMLLSGIYVQWKSLLEKYMERMDEEDHEKIFGQNAIECYGLSPAL